jgi:hypothetical protein
VTCVELIWYEWETAKWDAELLERVWNLTVPLWSSEEPLWPMNEAVIGKLRMKSVPWQTDNLFRLYAVTSVFRSSSLILSSVFETTWLDNFATISILLVGNTKAQTPLIRFVVDLLSTFQLFDKSTTNPKHLDMSRCCGFVVNSTTNRNNGVWLSTCPQVEMLYKQSTTLGHVVQLVVQQIEQVEF